MADPSIFDGLDDGLDPQEPLFPVEAPDGRKELSELTRAKMFRAYMAKLAPKVTLYANANAGKRNPNQARAEGIRAGVPDYTAFWDIADSTHPDCDVSVCWIEMKGYSAAGQPGKLSDAQIAFMNDLHRRGHKVACFFSGKSAFDWLASLGAPVAGRITA